MKAGADPGQAVLPGCRIPRGEDLSGGRERRRRLEIGQPLVDEEGSEGAAFVETGGQGGGAPFAQDVGWV